MQFRFRYQLFFLHGSVVLGLPPSGDWPLDGALADFSEIECCQAVRRSRSENWDDPESSPLKCLGSSLPNVRQYFSEESLKKTVDPTDRSAYLFNMPETTGQQASVTSLLRSRQPCSMSRATGQPASNRSLKRLGLLKERSTPISHPRKRSVWSG